MVNLVGEIAQYAVEVDQIIKALAKERDDLKYTTQCMEQEIRTLRQRNEELSTALKNIPPGIVRKTDEVKEAT